MREERLKRIEQYLLQHEVCRLDTLSELMGVSKMTVRRDVDALCEMGVVHKVYGGVRHNRRQGVAPLLSYFQREVAHVKEKDYIGSIAGGLTHEKEVVFLDSGTTIPLLVKYLSGKQVNIVTHNLSALGECSKQAGLNLFGLGGEYNRMGSSFAGELTQEEVGRYNITTAFIAATGVSLEVGYTCSIPLEAAIKRLVIQKATRVYALVDHTKWNVSAMMTFAKLTDIQGVITDRRPPAEFMNLFQQNGIEVHY
ncbi:DeoR/GlpR family DNA-binding transcription regulator [Oscillospiraceae bacterium MB08-C2-2]|nr:DeoR/GlpR family DNA-binding transcription regulator [Oscillospiraceae bacterium MB08-C2-2]